MDPKNGNTKKLSELIADDKNANRGTKRGRAMLERSLKEYGAGRSVLIDKNGKIIAGNKTTQNAAAAGIEDVIIVQTNGKQLVAVQRTDLDLDTDKAARELAIADNRVSEVDLSWDPLEIKNLDMDLSKFWSNNELQRIIEGFKSPEAPEAKMDMADELQAKWNTEPNQVWTAGKQRLMCGDATDSESVEKLLAGEKPELCVTDPPYGVEYNPAWRAEAGINKNQAKMGKVANDDRANWQEAWALIPGNVIYIWHASLRTAEVKISIEDAGFEAIKQIIWAKDRFALSQGNYHWQHEPCWYAVRKGKNHAWSGTRDQTTVWNIPRADDSGRGHGTQKPLECMARPIRNHIGNVYDPFCGSGTTLAAAELNYRSGFGMELEPKYCAVILERLSEMGLNPALS